MSALGYPARITGAYRISATTTVYYQPGFSAEAVRLVADLGLTGADVRPVPPSGGSTKDDQVDLIAVAGSEVAT